MLTPEQRSELAANHFTKEEIDKLNSDLTERPQVLNLNTATWQDTMNRRRVWYNAQIRIGISSDQVKNQIKAWYRASTENTLWALLRAEYQPPNKIKQLMDALKRRKEAEEKESKKTTEARDKAKNLYKKGKN